MRSSSSAAKMPAKHTGAIWFRRDQLHQRIEDMIGGVRIEIAGRLVRQQHPRRVGDRARDRDALLLAAGQFGRPVRDALARARDRPEFRWRA